MLKEIIINIIIAIICGFAFGYIVHYSDTYICEPNQNSQIAIKELPPIVTNLSDSNEIWIRLESSLLYNPQETHSTELMVSSATYDILNYLRTLKYKNINGSFALKYIREEINNRLKMRFNTQVKEIMIQSLVIQ
jgi:flagellar protein FliL